MLPFGLSNAPAGVWLRDVRLQWHTLLQSACASTVSPAFIATITAAAAVAAAAIAIASTAHAVAAAAIALASTAITAAAIAIASTTSISFDVTQCHKQRRLVLGREPLRRRRNL